MRGEEQDDNSLEGKKNLKYYLISTLEYSSLLHVGNTKTLLIVSLLFVTLLLLDRFDQLYEAFYALYFS